LSFATVEWWDFWKHLLWRPQQPIEPDLRVKPLPADARVHASKNPNLNRRHSRHCMLMIEASYA
jgi:hypothetical protein